MNNFKEAQLIVKAKGEKSVNKYFIKSVALYLVCKAYRKVFFLMLLSIIHVYSVYFIYGM